MAVSTIPRVQKVGVDAMMGLRECIDEWVVVETGGEQGANFTPCILRGMHDFMYLRYSKPDWLEGTTKTLSFIEGRYAIRTVRRGEEVLYDNRDTVAKLYARKSKAGVETLTQLTFGPRIALILRDERARASSTSGTPASVRRGAAQA